MVSLRCTLYPSLQDHDLVKKYQPVRGMAQDVFFLDHRNAEDGAGEDSMSRTNSYEVITGSLVLNIPCLTAT